MVGSSRAQYNIGDDLYDPEELWKASEIPSERERKEPLR
jgi:hypothetical protein